VLSILENIKMSSIVHKLMAVSFLCDGLGIEKSCTNAGQFVTVPFFPGRTDASQNKQM
jgi:catalase (peroxidase I)